MRGDLRIGSLLHRVAQRLLCLVELAQAELRPADAVEDEGIVGRKREGALDERVSLGNTRRPVDERIAERIERLRTRRLELHQTRKL